MKDESIEKGNGVLDCKSTLGHIDQYELLRELGGGGFGCVYLARDKVADIEVAVKGLPSLVRNNKEELENIRRNFALVSRLHHPNIAAALTLHPAVDVEYYDKADADRLRVFKGDTLVVMQYASGVTLSKWAKGFSGGVVPLEQAVDVTTAIACALDYAHAEKILHRDIKPENVMIDVAEGSRMTVRVLDFGLAAEIHSSISRVSNDVSSTSGTRPYMAPEQWLGDTQGHETDQYSLAALFYELVTGKVPFASAFETGDPLVMFGAVSRKEVEVPSWLPKPVRQALAKALSKKRGARFASCMQFAEALGLGVKSRRMSIIVASSVLLGVFAVAGAILYRASNGRPEVEPSDCAESQQDFSNESPLIPESEATPVSKSESKLAPASAHALEAKPKLETVSVPLASTEARNPKMHSFNLSEDVQRESDRDSVKSQAKLPPELRIVAMFEGKEITGAKIQTMNGTFELPYKWEGSIAHRRQLGPYKVTYERGREYLTGEFKIEAIDWSGLKTIEVNLKRSDREAKSGIQTWAF